MFSFSLEFEDELALRETTRKLISVHGVTGEISCRRLQDSRWRLDVVAEHELGEGVVESLKGQMAAAADCADE